MSLASVLQSAHSGMSAAAAAVDAVSLNMANSLTKGYKAVHPVFVTETAGQGVQVAGFVTDNSAGPLVVSTSDGGGDASGLVELSNTDVGEELVQMILAADQFMANASVFETADDLLVDLIQMRREHW